MNRKTQKWFVRVLVFILAVVLLLPYVLNILGVA